MSDVQAPRIVRKYELHRNKSIPANLVIHSRITIDTTTVAVANVRQKVMDGVVRGLIDRWLKTGVMEDGQLSYQSSGTPRGGVVLPLLAKIYLHEVLDTWFEQMVKPRLRGEPFMVRFADDATLMVFEHEQDACRVLQVLALYR